MKFNIGEVPKSEGFSSDNFTLLREPSGAVFERIVGILFLLFSLSMWGVWVSQFSISWPNSGPRIVAEILILAIVLIPVHEALHAVTYPRNQTGEIVLGFWPEKFYFYAAYTGEMSRSRLLLMYAMPFLVLSVGPAGLAALGDTAPSWLALMSIINAGFSSADLYIMFLLISQVPRRAFVKNNGWKTYWRER